MKNIGVKIIILGLLIAVAVAGILVFYPTIVAPPVDVPVSNLHKSTLEADIRDFSDMEDDAFNDSLYNAIVDKIALYKSEKFVTKGEADLKTKDLVESYVPVFYKLCYDKFEASVWYESDHTAMRNRIADIRKLKLDNGSANAVTGKYENYLTDIENVIKDYNDAKSLVSSSYKFKSVADANDKISRAAGFLKNEVITNCIDLKNGLKAVKTNVGNAHYDHVKSQVNALANYRAMTKPGFRKMENTVNNDYIKPFEQNQHNYGLIKGDAADLRSLASKYHREYEEYFKPRVTIYDNYSWRSKDFYHSSYMLYESYSNHNVPSSEAVMRVDIWGYEEFELLVRSYAEGNCDYVTVSELDNSSTVKVSTKGNQNAGTSLSSYTEVNYTNIDGRDHSIYIKYRKDVSYDYYDDRGYVLIPKPNN